MKFNDYKLTSDKECEILNKSYEKVFIEEIDDLNEILDKMIKQREEIEKENISGEYTSLLDKLKEDIANLENIVRSTMKNKKYSSTYNLSVPSAFRQVKKLDEDPPITPIRSIEENRRNIGKNPNTRVAKKNTRRYPYWGAGLFDFIQKFNVSKNKKSADNSAPSDKFRYHTIIATSCHPRKRIIHNQSDIIRLLLLYMILRPNCRYMSTIANITNRQFESYVEITQKAE